MVSFLYRYFLECWDSGPYNECWNKSRVSVFTVLYCCDWTWPVLHAADTKKWQWRSSASWRRSSTPTSAWLATDRRHSLLPRMTWTREHTMSAMVINTPIRWLVHCWCGFQSTWNIPRAAVLCGLVMNWSLAPQLQWLSGGLFFRATNAVFGAWPSLIFAYTVSHVCNKFFKLISLSMYFRWMPVAFGTGFIFLQSRTILHFPPCHSWW